MEDLRGNSQAAGRGGLQEDNCFAASCLVSHHNPLVLHAIACYPMPSQSLHSASWHYGLDSIELRTMIRTSRPQLNRRVNVLLCHQMHMHRTHQTYSDNLSYVSSAEPVAMRCSSMPTYMASPRMARSQTRTSTLRWRRSAGQQIWACTVTLVGVNMQMSMQTTPSLASLSGNQVMHPQFGIYVLFQQPSQGKCRSYTCLMECMT